VVAIIERLRELGTAASLEALADSGGEAELYRNPVDVAASDAFDVVASILTSAWPRVDHMAASQLLILGLRNTPDPLAFSGTIDAIFSAPVVVAAMAEELEAALLERAALRTDAREAHIAIDAIDGMLRLVLADAARPFRLLALLSGLSTDEHPSFAEAVARRLGVVYLHIAEPSARGAARDALTRLTAIPPARGDVEHELGAARLVDALESTVAAEVEHALREARKHFAAALQSDAERLDAQLYANALDGVLALVEHRPAEVVSAAADEVEQLALVRSAWQAPGRLSHWLGDRAAAEREWWMVTATFAAAAHHLDDDAWLNAGASLEAIARAHRAAGVANVLGIEPGPGLRAVVEPRISEAFVRFHDRTRALKRWIQGIRDDPDLADAVAGLEVVVDDPKGEPATAIAALRAQAPHPEAFDALLAGVTNRQQQLLERRLETLDGEDSVLVNPAARRVRNDVRAALEGLPDYEGQTRIFFDRIVDLTIRFVESRQNLQPGFAKGRFSYLADPDALELAMQLDYFDYLTSTELGGVVDLEVVNRGAGRADVHFALGGRHIVAELKRDKNAVVPGKIDTYLDQAGMYQSSNVALGLLLILDLSPKPGGQIRSLGQSFWVAEKPSLAPGDARRAIVTAVVAGNRPSPSAVK
jgi:hypothetical protein